ncbi:MAG: PilZ domain-containing protein [Bdellovibrionales bacterium]|nr:PilZ domain-containing protein [Bdellovibrionales bacterium]
MDQIGIIGKPSRKRFQIVNHLEGRQTFRVRIFSHIDEVRLYLKDGKLSGVLFLEDQFEDEHIELMDAWSQEHPDLAILFLVSQITTAQREEMNRYKIPNCTVLDLNYELRDLSGVVRRMVAGEPVILRSHFRFQVSKKAFLFTGPGAPVSIQLVDLSYGGLQARLNGSQVKKGQKIQIKVPLDAGKKGSHIIVGRVAWISPKGFMGMRFDEVVQVKAGSSLALAA